LGAQAARTFPWGKGVRVVAGHEGVHRACRRPMVSTDGNSVTPAADVVSSVKTGTG